MKLSAPTQLFFWLSLVLAIVGLLAGPLAIGALAGVAAYAGWLMFAGWLVLAAGCLMRGM